MKYKNREIEMGEEVLVFGDAGKSITAKYVRDEKIELTTPVFEYEEEEIRGFQCYWIPKKEAEEGERKGNYDERTSKFDKERGTSKK